MQCTAKKGQPTRPFGFHGSRGRCPNPAAARVSCYSTENHRVSRFVVCSEHLGSGRQGMQTPTGWHWEIQSL